MYVCMYVCMHQVCTVSCMYACGVTKRSEMGAQCSIWQQHVHVSQIVQCHNDDCRTCAQHTGRVQCRRWSCVEMCMCQHTSDLVCVCGSVMADAHVRDADVGVSNALPCHCEHP